MIGFLPNWQLLHSYSMPEAILLFAVLNLYGKNVSARWLGEVLVKTKLPTGGNGHLLLTWNLILAVRFSLVCTNQEKNSIKLSMYNKSVKTSNWSSMTVIKYQNISFFSKKWLWQQIWAQIGVALTCTCSFSSGLPQKDILRQQKEPVTIAQNDAT